MVHESVIGNDTEAVELEKMDLLLCFFIGLSAGHISLRVDYVIASLY